jgi:hypothetical protein
MAVRTLRLPIWVGATVALGAMALTLPERIAAQTASTPTPAYGSAVSRALSSARSVNAMQARLSELVLSRDTRMGLAPSQRQCLSLDATSGYGWTGLRAIEI